MKKIGILVASFFIISCFNINSHFDTFSAESFGIKGEIISFIEKRYPATLENDSIIEKTDIIGNIEIHKFFNEKNQLVKSIYYDGNGEFYSFTKILIDESGKYIGTETYDSNDKLISEGKTVSSTDTSLVFETKNFPKNTISLSKMTYYENRLNKTIYSELNDSSSIFWKYYRDSNGLIVKTQMVNWQGSTKDTSYHETKYIEFDNHGNWIKRIDYKENDVYVYERKIEYRKK
jgi:hypothetical protein